MSHCKYCDKELIWIETQNGKAMPCEYGVVADPVPGQTLITQEGRVVLFRLGMELDPNINYYNCHFGRCPDYKPKSEGLKKLQQACKEQRDKEWNAGKLANKRFPGV